MDRIVFALRKAIRHLSDTSSEISKGKISVEGKLHNDLDGSIAPGDRSSVKGIKCPICRGKHYEIDSVADVCRMHDGWLLTKCDVCYRLCFSESAGVCGKCGGDDGSSRAPAHGSGDHRAMLRYYGLEDYE